MNNNDNNKQKPGNGKNPIIPFLIISIVATVVLNLVLTSLTSPKIDEIPYSEFVNMLDEDKVEEVILTTQKIEIYKRASATPTTSDKLMQLWGIKDTKQREVCYTGFINDPELLKKLEEKNVKYSTPIHYSNPVLEFFLSWILPLLFIYGMFFLVSRSLSKKMGGGIMGVGQSKAKMYMQDKTGITFKDVAGQEEAKESLDEIVDFLHNPAKYTAIGAKQPKGALLRSHI